MAMTVAVMAMGARDRLYINDFSISAGQSKTIEVLLANDTTYCGLQTDIVLPDGLTIDLDDGEYIVDLTSRKGRDHTVSTNLLADGAIRIFVTSQNSRAFSGTSGAIMTIDLTAASTFDKGNVTLRNTVAVEENGTRHLLAEETAKVNGGSGGGVKGDVNGDGLVSGADVTALYNVLLNGAVAAGDADVNGDGVVSGADVTALYSLLLQ